VDELLLMLAGSDPSLRGLEVESLVGHGVSPRVAQLRAIALLRRGGFEARRDRGDSKRVDQVRVRRSEAVTGQDMITEPRASSTRSGSRVVPDPVAVIESNGGIPATNAGSDMAGPGRPAWSLAIALHRFESARPRARPTSSLRAYELYLRGLERYRIPSPPEMVLEVDRSLRAAIREDPYFAEPRAVLATQLVGLSAQVRPAIEVLPEARELAEKAAELKPDSAEAHTALGNVAMQADRDWVAAEEEFRKAISLNPGDPAAHGWYGFLLEVLQRYGAANRQGQVAQYLDPMWAIPEFQVLTLRRSPAEPVTLMQRCGGLMSKFGDRVEVRAGFGWGCALSGHAREANASVRGLSSAPDFTSQRARAEVLAALGNPGAMRELVQDWEDQRFAENHSLSDLAQCYSLAGDPEAALEALERDSKAGYPNLWYVYEDRSLDPLRRDPRFSELLTRSNLPSTLSRPLVSVARAK